MTFTTMSLRTVGGLSAGMLALGILAACTPAPEPEPTPTELFASDEEAFAAAEETYRAYNDAGNSSRRGESADPQDYLVGRALEGHIDAQRYLDEEGLRLEGNVLVSSFRGVDGSVENSGQQLMAIVCLDISETTTHTESGTPVPDRPPIIAQQVEMTWVGGNYRISDEFEEDNEVCAE